MLLLLLSTHHKHALQTDVVNPTRCDLESKRDGVDTGRQEQACPSSVDGAPAQTQPPRPGQRVNTDRTPIDGRGNKEQQVV